MISSPDWSLALPIGVGLGALIVGIGIFVVCLRLAGLIGRFERTLDVVDGQIPTLTEPVATTLTHVGGIANTADATIARLGVAVAKLEDVAASASRTAGTVGNVVRNVAETLRPS